MAATEVASAAAALPGPGGSLATSHGGLLAATWWSLLLSPRHGHEGCHGAQATCEVGYRRGNEAACALAPALLLLHISLSTLICPYLVGPFCVWGLLACIKMPDFPRLTWQRVLTSLMVSLLLWSRMGWIVHGIVETLTIMTLLVSPELTSLITHW